MGGFDQFTKGVFKFIGFGAKHADDIAKGGKSIAGLGKKIAWGVAGAGALGTIGSLLDLYFNDREKFNELMDTVKGLLSFENKEGTRTYITYDEQRNITVNPDAVFRKNDNGRYILCKTEEEREKALKAGTGFSYITMNSVEKTALENQIRENIQNAGGFDHLKDGTIDKIKNKNFADLLKNNKSENPEKPDNAVKRVENGDYLEKLKIASSMTNNEIMVAYAKDMLTKNTVSLTLNYTDKQHLRDNIENLIQDLNNKADITENVLFHSELKENASYRNGIYAGMDKIDEEYRKLYENYIDGIKNKPDRELSPQDVHIKNLFSNISDDEKMARIHIISALSTRERVTDLFGNKPLSLSSIKQGFDIDIQRMINDPGVSANFFREHVNNTKECISDSNTDEEIRKYYTVDDTMNHRTMIEKMKEYGSIIDILKNLDEGKTPEAQGYSSVDDEKSVMPNGILEWANSNIYNPVNDSIAEALKKPPQGVSTKFDINN